MTRRADNAEAGAAIRVRRFAFGPNAVPMLGGEAMARQSNHVMYREARAIGWCFCRKLINIMRRRASSVA